MSKNTARTSKDLGFSKPDGFRSQEIIVGSLSNHLVENRIDFLLSDYLH